MPLQLPRQDCQRLIDGDAAFFYLRVKLLAIYASTPVITLALVLNVLNIIYVVQRNVRRPATRALNLTIPIVNLGILFFSPMFWHVTADPWNLSVIQPALADLLAGISIFLLRFLGLASAWLSVLVSIERMLHFQQRSVYIRASCWTWSRLHWAIPPVLIFTFCAEVPRAMIQTNLPTACPPARSLAVVSSTSELFIGFFGPSVAHLWLAAATTCQSRPFLSKFEPKCVRAARGMRVTTVICLVTVLPYLFVPVMFMPTIMGDSKDVWGLFATRGVVAELSFYLGTLQNFAVYYLLSTRLRKALRELSQVCLASNKGKCGYEAGLQVLIVQNCPVVKSEVPR